MQELEAQITKKCIEEQRINHIYDGDQIIQTNEEFEVIDKKAQRKRKAVY